MKIYLIAIIKVKPQYREEVLNTLQNMVAHTRKETECESYNLHQGLDDENLFTFYEVWKSQEGLDAHNQQPYIQAFGQLIADKLVEKPTILLTNLI